MSNNSSSRGIGFSGMLTLLFIILKLIGIIDWSWWWVMSPMWIGFVATIVVLFILVLLDR